MISSSRSTFGNQAVGECVDRTVDYWHGASASFDALCDRVCGMHDVCSQLQLLDRVCSCENLFVAIYASKRMGPHRLDRLLSLSWRVRWQSRMRSNGVCVSQRGFRGGALRHDVIAAMHVCVDACTAVR